MSRWRLVLRSLLHHWRINLAVALGVMAGTAVLTGALLVGDSVHFSLHRLALDRLGSIDEIVLSDRFFRAALADELAGTEDFDDHFTEALPAIVLTGTAERSGMQADSDTLMRTGGVTVIGCDERFWKLAREKVTPPKLPGKREVVLNRALADELGIGDDDLGTIVSLRLPKVSAVPGESLLGRKTDTTRSLAELKVVDIVEAEGLGRFGLRPTQQLPRNAYLSIEVLQKALGQKEKVNAILVAGLSGGRLPKASVLDTGHEALAEMLHPTLADLGFSVSHVRRTFTDPQSATGQPGTEQVVHDYFQLTSDGMLFSPSADAAAEQALAADHAQPALTYLANTIGVGQIPSRTVAEHLLCMQIASPPLAQSMFAPLIGSLAERDIPYSTVTAVDSIRGLGPLLDSGAAPIAVGDDQVVLNRWAADQLGATVGDTIRLDYFEPQSTHGAVRERTRRLTLSAVVELTEPDKPYRRNRPAQYKLPPTIANDPDLTPTVPGITDKAAIDDWDAPFPFHRDRIRKQDTKYWDNHRTTPKAFVSLGTGREFWGSRFGQTTAYRVAAAEGVSESTLAAKFREQLQRDRQTLDLRILPVKRDALKAAAGNTPIGAGTTPFNVLFLGFSFFLIASALMLVALLFRLGIEQRAEQIGILLAAGFRRRTTVKILALEGALVAAVGSVLGTVGGVGYAWLMLVGLKTDWLWLGAVGTPFLDLHLTRSSLLIGYASGGIAAMGTIAWTTARMCRVSVVRLVAGEAFESVSAFRRRKSIVPIIAWLLLVGAGSLAAVGVRLGGEQRAGAFFGTGAAVLAALLLMTWWRLRSGMGEASLGAGPAALARLAVRNGSRNAGRSTLTIGLVAAATFQIVAVSAFRIQPSEQGTGGFDLIAESDRPIYHDLALPNNRDLYGIDEEASALLDRSTLISLRVQPGDDASCRNLYQASQPRLIGITPAMIEYFSKRSNGLRFAFAAAAAKTPEQEANPWRLLAAGPDRENANEEDSAEAAEAAEDDGAEVDDTVPVILDKNTAMWALHLYGGVGETFEIDHPAGGKIRLRVVGLLDDSIFQGNLLIGQSDFLRLFPEVGGYRLFLVKTPADRRTRITSLLEHRLGDYGFDAELARRRMESLQVVQNTYLSTFQSLGALGLLLGTFGLATVQIRSVLERRGELALMRAAGFRRSRLAQMVMLENGALLLSGLATGVASALITVLPNLLLGGASVPFGTLALLLATVLVVGLLSSLIAVRYALRAPLLPALRGE